MELRYAARDQGQQGTGVLIGGPSTGSPMSAKAILIWENAGIIVLCRQLKDVFVSTSMQFLSVCQEVHL